MLKSKLNVIFPMAGDGVRFGGEDFKPFIDCTEKLFIEVASESFASLRDRYLLNYYFVFREDQEIRFNVTERLTKLFDGNNIHMCIIKNKTSGPFESVITALKEYNILGSSFVCDSDHYVDIRPMIHDIENTAFEIIIPTCTFQEKNYANWGKVKKNLKTGQLSFYEKEFVLFEPNYVVLGLIGCYFFRNIEIIKHYSSFANFSDIFPLLIKDEKLISIVEIINRGSFGTPDDLIKYRYELATKRTYFVDIDGTLIYLPKHVSYESKNIKVLEGTLENLTKWRNQGHKIVLTTGRVTERRDKLEQMLKELKIPYDQLITGLHSGPRILINDKKPYSIFHRMAVAVQLKRNEGISSVNIPETPEIIRLLKGGSFASVFLIKNNGIYMVRKYIEKKPETKIHYETLRRQLDELKRFDFYCSNITPKVYEVFESEDEFYFDMEYLENHTELSHLEFDKIKQIIPSIIKLMTENIYCYSKKIDGIEWLNRYINEKVIGRFQQIEQIGDKFIKLLNSKYVIINKKSVKGLRYFIETLDMKKYAPNFICPIHGDLTLENILYNQINNDIKLIDQSGARYMEPPELDSGKLLQSMLSKYETWDSREWLVKVDDEINITIPDEFLNLQIDSYTFFLKEYGNDIQDIYTKSVFHLGFHLVRAIPYLLKKSESHSICAFSIALYLFSFI
jgi:thiamine kinase-like enzyme